MIARGRDGRRQPEAIRDRTDPRTLERQGRRQSHRRSRAKATLHQAAGKGKLAEGDLGHHGRGVNQGLPQPAKTMTGSRLRAVRTRNHML